MRQILKNLEKSGRVYDIASDMRWIAHVDMDSFFVSVERLKNPKLIGKPVVVGGLGRRSVVASASYEARKFGVRSAMPMEQARQLCPNLIIVEPSGGAYSRVSRKIFSALQTIVPVVEQVSVDEAYLDFTGCERLFSTREESGKRVKEIIRQTSSLPSTVAISTNKLVAKIASDFAKPDGLFVVPPGKEQEFLAPLSIRKIPGVGPKTAVIFERGGIDTCGQLALAKPSWVKDRFGDYALEIQRSTLGLDDSEVYRDEERKSLGAEETFEYDINDMTKLTTIIRAMSDEVAGGLRAEKLKAQTVQIKIRYPDFSTYTRAKTLSQPTHISRDIGDVALELLQKHKDPNLPLRLLGVSVRNMIAEKNAGPQQMNLFESPRRREKEEKLELLKDELQRKFGSKVLIRPR